MSEERRNVLLQNGNSVRRIERIHFLLTAFLKRIIFLKMY